MNFEEVEHTLPNGFHDAELRRFEMDYVQRKLQFDLDVWIGDMDNPPEDREIYRPARVTVENVAFLVIEPPDTSYPMLKRRAIIIDTGEGQPRQSSGDLPATPSGCHLTWMYLHALNRFLLFAGGATSLEWTGPEENHDGG